MNHRLSTLSLIAWLAVGVASLPVPAAHAQLLGIEPRFTASYQDHDGSRLLGLPLTQLYDVEGYPAQLFDKGRLEDHRGAAVDPAWSLMLGRLTAELLAGAGPMGLSWRRASPCCAARRAAGCCSPTSSGRIWSRRLRHPPRAPCSRSATRGGTCLCGAA